MIISFGAANNRIGNFYTKRSARASIIWMIRWLWFGGNVPSIYSLYVYAWMSFAFFFFLQCWPVLQQNYSPFEILYIHHMYIINAAINQLLFAGAVSTVIEMNMNIWTDIFMNAGCCVHVNRSQLNRKYAQMAPHNHHQHHHSTDRRNHYSVNGQKFDFVWTWTHTSQKTESLHVKYNKRAYECVLW